MDKQTFETIKKIVDRIKKLENEKGIDATTLLAEMYNKLRYMETKGNILYLDGKKVYEFYVPKDGKDGKDGESGKDGFSPLVNTEQTESGAKITITDTYGSHQAEVFNGKAGERGPAGKDGKDGRNGTEIELFTVDDKICWSYKGSDVYYDLIDLDKLKGKNGKDGKDGRNGKSGTTPHIGDNGNWWIGQTDTGVKAEGNIINTLNTNLETNKVYRGIISTNTAFVLPTVTDNTILNTIQIQVTISNYDSITIDLGTTKFFGDIPELGNGSFILYYEYDGSNWCVGALPVVSEV